MLANIVLVMAYLARGVMVSPQRPEQIKAARTGQGKSPQGWINKPIPERHPKEGFINPILGYWGGWGGLIISST